MRCGTKKMKAGGPVKKYQQGGSVTSRGNFRTGGTDISENERIESLRRAEDRAANSLADSYVRIGQVPRGKIAPSGNYARDLMARDVNRAREMADEELMRRRGSLYNSVREGGPKQYKKGGNVSSKKGKK